MDKKPGKVLPFSSKGVAKGAKSTHPIDISASSSQGEPVLSEEGLRAAVARIVLYGTFSESRHSAQDRSYRNISQDDILAMLEGVWKMHPRPEWDEAHRNWKYKLTGEDADGDELVLIVAVNVERNHMDIITKF